MKTWTVILWALVLSGCFTAHHAPAKPAQLQPQVIHRDTQCSISGSNPAAYPAATWIDQTSDLKRHYQRLGNNIVGLAPIKPPDIDFSRFGILMVEMGPKPTAGYQLEMPPQDLSINNQTARITLTWTAPAPGRLLAQVITHPCILIKLPRGNFSQIYVLDQKGRQRAEVQLKSKMVHPGGIRPAD